MKKSVLSALGLGLALAFSAPIFAEAATVAKPAVTSTVVHKTAAKKKIIRHHKKHRKHAVVMKKVEKKA